MDMALRLPGEAVDHREAKPGPLPERLGGEEWIEGARPHGRRHANTAVRDAQAHVRAGSDIAEFGGKGRLDLGVHDFDSELAAVRHGVARIDDKIEQRAFKL